jgi:glycosyltransferase involved in cell wall biosynthesis
MSEKKLSVVLAVYNEEKNITRCLEAVKDIADEIIVVDGESTDQTVELAKKVSSKVRIISTTNKLNFHINKQMAMDAARGDLVLQLDADEVVDAHLAKFIQKTVVQIESGSAAQLPAAWWVKRKNWFMGRFLKKGGQYPDPAIRLYQKGKARLPQKDVHEWMTVDGEVGWAEGDLLHYGNANFAEYLRRFNTYTSFTAQQLYDQKLPINLFNSYRYLLWRPFATFFSIYFRHAGFLTDGVAGCVFALFSGLHHFVAYLKLWELYES